MLFFNLPLNRLSGVVNLLLLSCIVSVSTYAQNVGIGTSNPSANLHVNGTFKLVDGTEGNGKVLMSDPTGKASWQALMSNNTNEENVSGMGNWNECISPNVTAYQPVSGMEAEGFMGKEVAVTNDFAFVGVPAYDTLGRTNTGIVVVYQLIGNVWNEVQRIADLNGQSNAYFGWSVAASDNEIIIGAPSENTNGYYRAGAVCIYHLNGGLWEFKQKLSLAAPAPYDNFGWSVDIHQDYLVVGANGYSTVGRVFIYKLTSGNWEYFTELANPGGIASDAFGESVAISDDLLAVGCPGKDLDSLNAGSVYFYKRAGTSYNLKSQLFPQSFGFGQNANANFGRSISMDSTYLVVGVPGFVVNAKAIGALALYKYDGSVLQHKGVFKSNTFQDGDEFGNQVRVSYPYCIASAPGADPQGKPESGLCRLYKFNQNNLTLLSEIVDPSGEPGYNGFFVAINGTNRRFVIGNPYKNNQSGGVIFGKVKF